MRSLLLNGSLWLFLVVLIYYVLGENVIADTGFSTEFQVVRRVSIPIALLTLPFAIRSARQDVACPVRRSGVFCGPGLIVAILFVLQAAMSPATAATWSLPLATLLSPLSFPPLMFVIAAWCVRSRKSRCDDPASIEVPT